MGELRSRIEKYFDRLWPICRSIAGPGFRESLDILSEVIPTERLRFRTGHKVFDWQVPKEWVVREAYFVDPKGVKHADFKSNNLHILNYSVPFRGVMPLEKLKPHLHSLPDQPKAIPYVTSYYDENWGFCISNEELQRLPKGNYEVVVDTERRNGWVEVGEAVLPGRTKKEVLFSSYLCHPSLANNELTGPLVLAFLYEKLAKMARRHYSYRFVILPETIGSICYLSKRGTHLKKHLIAGYVLTCLGDRGPFTYKLSRDGQSLADRAARLILRDIGKHQIVPFVPHMGSDERQYGSPGFNLPVGSLMRTMYGCYPEYHTSDDNKTFISFEAMEESLGAYVSIVKALEGNCIWRGTVMYCEPQLGKRGLYPRLGTKQLADEKLRATMWLLNLADGTQDLLAIADKSGCRMELLVLVADELEKAGLLKDVDCTKSKDRERRSIRRLKMRTRAKL